MHMNCILIQDAFSDYLNGDKKAIKRIEKDLSNQLKKDISITIIPKKNRKELFAMAVTPEASVIEKIATSIASSESKLSTVTDLWRKCQKWTLEIDAKLFDFLNAGELTALTMHEVGHVVQTDAVPRRICNILQYALATGKLSQRLMMKDNVLNKILQIPIVAACQYTKGKDGLREELKADKMATYNGYLPELDSAIGKISKQIYSGPEYEAANLLTEKTLSQLEKRQSQLVKNNLTGLSKALPEQMRLRETITNLTKSWFEDGASYFEYALDHLDETIENEYMAEFGDFRKKLKPIDQNQLDYIQIKVQAIQTINDKMMIVSYINSKIELVQYYLGILEDPKSAKKYKVPHTKSQLTMMLDVLYRSKELAINKKLQGDTRIITIYPEGYEG